MGSTFVAVGAHLRLGEARVRVDLERGDVGGRIRGAALAHRVDDGDGEPLGVREGAARGVRRGGRVRALVRPRRGRRADVHDGDARALRRRRSQSRHPALPPARVVEHEDVVRGVHQVHRAPLEEPAVRVQLRLPAEGNQHALLLPAGVRRRRGVGRVRHVSRREEGSERGSTRRSATESGRRDGRERNREERSAGSSRRFQKTSWLEPVGASRLPRRRHVDEPTLITKRTRSFMLRRYA